MRNKRSGSALILTLWVMAALILLATGLSVTVRTESRIARNYTERIRCRWAARTGIAAVMAKPPEDVLQLLLDGGAEGAVLTSEELGLDMGGVIFSVRIEDEAGKANVNTAPAGMLELLLDSTEAADCIIDWRDADDDPRPSGAESGYYSTLKEAYQARNAPLTTIGELRLVKGLNELLFQENEGTEVRLLTDVLTVYSYDRNLDAAGKKRLNLLSADEAQLRSSLGEWLDEDQIKALAESLQRSKPTAVADIVSVRELARSDIRDIFDLLTLSEEENYRGLININTAPAEVLAAVPGLDSAIAEAIVTFREENGPFASVGSLLDISAVTDEAFRASAAMLTVRSGVYRLTATGCLPDGSLPFTITSVIDFTERDARIFYWQE